MPSFVLLDAFGITAITIISVVLIAGIVFLVIILHKRKLHVTAESYKNKYDTYHTQLTIDCKNMISRLKVLGESNDYFATMHEEKKKQYDEIISHRDADISLILKSLDSLIAEKKYKDFKKVANDCRDSLINFEKAVSNFNSELNNILQDDTSVHTSAVNVKTKYREIKSFYEEHQSELAPLEKSFNHIFLSAEVEFSKFEKASNSADFKASKEIIDQLTKLFDAILFSLHDDLPRLEVSITTVLPSKMDEVLVDYNKMIEDKYVVNQMNVETRIANMKQRLVELQNQLNYLNTKDVRKSIDDMQSEITEILAGFSNERKAKEIFLSKQDTIGDSSFKVEKRYYRLIKQLPEYKATFILANKQVNPLNNLKDDIETIGILKRDLDSYLGTSAKQPYTVITRKIADLENILAKAKRVMDDYENYLLSLKNDSTIVFNGLRKCYDDLKETENIVKEIGVNSYSNAVSNDFSNAYKTIGEIYKLVIYTPIDVTKAMQLYKPFMANVDGFIAGIKKSKREAEEAECAIVYANAYRSDYVDSRTSLNQAEKYFFESNFKKAKDIALSVVKTFNLNTDNQQ